MDNNNFLRWFYAVVNNSKTNISPEIDFRLLMYLYSMYCKYSTIKYPPTSNVYLIYSVKIFLPKFTCFTAWFDQDHYLPFLKLIWLKYFFSYYISDYSNLPTIGSRYIPKEKVHIPWNSQHHRNFSVYSKKPLCEYLTWTHMSEESSIYSLITVYLKQTNWKKRMRLLLSLRSFWLN